MSRAPTLLLLLALQGGAWAGPVPVAEAEAASAAATLHSLPALGEGLAAQPAASAASAAAGSELAAQMIKEAEAGAVAAEASHAPRRDGDGSVMRPHATGTQARKPANDTDDPWRLRDIGKAALRWAKDAVPWLSDDDEVHDHKQQVLHNADWAASPLDGGATRNARPGAGAQPHAGASPDPMNQVGYGDGDTDKPRAAGSQHNVIGEIIGVLRLVLEHPMTWLVVSLFVIGGIVVKKIDRRPTK